MKRTTLAMLSYYEQQTEPQYPMLKPGYKRLPYIDSTGQHFASTGVLLSNTSGWELDIQMVTGGGSQGTAGLFGSRKNNTTDTRCWLVYDRSNKAIIGWNGSYEIPDFEFDRNRHLFQVNINNNRKVMIDGVDYLSLTEELSEQIYDAYIGRAHHQTGATVASSGIRLRMFRCRITEESTCTHDYVPAIRLSDNIPGFYDMKTDLFLVDQYGTNFPYSEVVLPTDDLVFYASLTSMTNVAETGQELVYSPNITQDRFGTYLGIRGLNTQDLPYDSTYGALKTTNFLNTGSPQMTLSIWECEPTKFQNNNGFLSCYVRRYGTSDLATSLRNSWNGEYSAVMYGKSFSGPTLYKIGSWRHVVGTHDGEISKLYINGTLVKEVENTPSLGGNYWYTNCLIGVGSSTANKSHSGWLSSARVYGRALTQTEVLDLSYENTPTY